MFSRIASFAMSCLPRPGAMSAQHHRRRVSVRCSCLPTGTATAMTFDTPGPPGAGVSCFDARNRPGDMGSGVVHVGDEMLGAIIGLADAVGEIGRAHV